MNLVLSLVALALGPLLYGACRKMNFVRSGLDGLLFVTIAGIVVVHIVPDVYNVAGFTALAFLAAGVGLAFLVERRPSLGNGDRYTWIILLGAIGLVIHAVMDGIALLPIDHLSGAEADAHHGHSHGPKLTLRHEHLDGHTHSGGLTDLFSNHLAFGVILHRIPVGMAIWWTVRPRLGKSIAIGALAIIAIATSAAYILGEPVIALMEAKSVACFQAFVAGTLLHVIVFTSVRRDTEITEKPHAQTVIGERLGIMAGLILIFLVPHAH